MSYCLVSCLWSYVRLLPLCIGLSMSCPSLVSGLVKNVYRVFIVFPFIFGCTNVRAKKTCYNQHAAKRNVHMHIAFV
jgi:hypothetical protein